MIVEIMRETKSQRDIFSFPVFSLISRLEEMYFDCYGVNF